MRVFALYHTLAKEKINKRGENIENRFRKEREFYQRIMFGTGSYFDGGRDCGSAVQRWSGRAYPWMEADSHCALSFDHGFFWNWRHQRYIF